MGRAYDLETGQYVNSLDIPGWLYGLYRAIKPDTVLVIDGARNMPKRLTVGATRLEDIAMGGGNYWADSQYHFHSDAQGERLLALRNSRSKGSCVQAYVTTVTDRGGVELQMVMNAAFKSQPADAQGTNVRNSYAWFVNASFDTVIEHLCLVLAGPCLCGSKLECDGTVTGGADS